MTMSDDETMREVLSYIGREVRYRDALHQIRSDIERLDGLVTLSARTRVAKEILATIDRALDLGGEFCGLPETP
jgi:hypothetical protein